MCVSVSVLDSIHHHSLAHTVSDIHSYKWRDRNRARKGENGNVRHRPDIVYVCVWECVRMYRCNTCRHASSAKYIRQMESEDEEVAVVDACVCWVNPFLASISYILTSSPSEVDSECGLNNMSLIFHLYTHTHSHTERCSECVYVRDIERVRSDTRMATPATQHTWNSMQWAWRIVNVYSLDTVILTHTHTRARMACQRWEARVEAQNADVDARLCDVCMGVWFTQRATCCLMDTIESIISNSFFAIFTADVSENIPIRFRPVRASLKTVSYRWRNWNKL